MKGKLKKAISIIVLIIFTIQIYNALRRYADDPTMFATDTIDIADIKVLPVVSICPPPTFDYDLSTQLGYMGKTQYFSGNVNGKDILSWTGNSGKSYEEVKKLLWAEMFAILDKVKVYNSNMEELETQTLINLPLGPCKFLYKYQIDSDKGALNIAAEEGEVTVFITDPANEMYFKTDMNSMSGNAVKLKMNRKNIVKKIYQVTLEETHYREGLDDCMVYDDDHSFPSYEACVEDYLQSQWLPVFGCIAPWMASGTGCNNTLQPTLEHEALINEAITIYKDSVYGHDHEFSNCLTPCVQTSVTSKYFESFTRPMYNASRISINFGPEVNLQIMESAYGEVDLLIEVGSSLGLWLGLSAIGVFDLLVIAVEKLRAKLNRF